MLNLYEQQRLQKRQEEMMRLKELEQKKALQIYLNENKQGQIPTIEASAVQSTGRQTSGSYGTSSSSTTNSQQELSCPNDKADENRSSSQGDSPVRSDTRASRSIKYKANNANDDESIEQSDYDNDEEDEFSGNGDDNDEVASFASDDGDDTDKNYTRSRIKRDLRESNVQKSTKRAFADDNDDDKASENNGNDRADGKARCRKEQKKVGSFAQV